MIIAAVAPPLSELVEAEGTAVVDAVPLGVDTGPVAVADVDTVGCKLVVAEGPWLETLPDGVDRVVAAVVAITNASDVNVLPLYSNGNWPVDTFVLREASDVLARITDTVDPSTVTATALSSRPKFLAISFRTLFAKSVMLVMSVVGSTRENA